MKLFNFNGKVKKPPQIFLLVLHFFAGIVFFVFLVTIAIKTDASDHLSFSGMKNLDNVQLHLTTVRALVRVRVCMLVHVCVRTLMRVRTLVRVHACACVRVFACARVRVCVCEGMLEQESGIDDLQRRVIRPGNGD